LVDDINRLVARTPAAFARQGIDVRIHHRVVAVDPAARRVAVLPPGASEPVSEPYDELVLATGAVPVIPPVDGRDAEGIFPVKTLVEAETIRKLLERRRPRRVVVVGGGYIGVEMAENLAHRGLEVTVVEMASTLMPRLDPDMGAKVTEAVQELGVRVLLEQPVRRFVVRDGAVRGVETDGGVVEADFVFLGLGVRPHVDLARQAGIPLGVADAIVVDEHMRTPVAGIWAAGDVAQSFHLVSRQPTYVPLGTVANKQGRVAGLNLAGIPATFPGVVGTAITRAGRWEIATTGLSTAEARDLGYDVVASTITAETKLGYFPDVGPITVKLIADRPSGRILGGQIIGTQGAGKRIDTIATALYAGLRADDMIHLDLAYAPPFSDVWDPVLIAARGLVR
jgi:NADPH-dependent 2,4-dienoyl-CoA reductase/sulfur reductase-like enzyme